MHLINVLRSLKAKIEEDREAHGTEEIDNMLPTWRAWMCVSTLCSFFLLLAENLARGVSGLFRHFTIDRYQKTDLDIKQRNEIRRNFAHMVASILLFIRICPTKHTHTHASRQEMQRHKERDI